MNKKVFILVGLLVILASLTACKTTTTPVVDNTADLVDANEPVSSDQVATNITSDLLLENDSVEIGEMI